MKLEIFCVRDRATVQFGTPMFLIGKGQAIRSFADEINRRADDNGLFKHPEDYDLYYLGSYDTSTGHFSAVEAEQIAVGKDLVINQG